MLVEQNNTEKQPVMVVDGIIYLPVYQRPTGPQCWAGPGKLYYSSDYLAAKGARIEMIDLWPRQWVKDLIKHLLNKNATYGEIRKAYEKAFGII